MKTIKVEEVFDPQEMQTVIISEYDSLEDVITSFVRDPYARGIFLVDSQQRFTGVITPSDLLKWAHLRFGREPGSGWVNISRRDIYRFVLSTSARDVARGSRRSLGVQPSDDLETALNQMFEHEEVDIPVLDEEGKILGGLKVSEVLLKALEVSRQD
jgi:CBS-domain-containing membrane protein